MQTTDERVQNVYCLKIANLRFLCESKYITEWNYK